MNKAAKCEFCDRTIKNGPVEKVLRGQKHVFCSDFCFRLFFFDAPKISYEELQKMYSYYCVSLPAGEFNRIVSDLTVEED
jgi:hypothetical protein